MYITKYPPSKTPINPIDNWMDSISIHKIDSTRSSHYELSLDEGITEKLYEAYIDPIGKSHDLVKKQ